jgi:hypothetical protein
MMPRRFIFVPFVLLAILFVSCASNPENPEANAPVAKEVAKKPELTEKLEYVQQGDFSYVFLFRRRDGSALDSADRKFLRENSSPSVNQWVVTDDGKAAIAGTNFRIDPKNLAALKKRFLVDDYSKNANQPANGLANVK